MFTVDQFADLLHKPGVRNAKEAQAAGQIAWKAQYKENDERTDIEQTVLNTAHDELIEEGMRIT
jgi:hypothetical protein